MRAHRTKVLMGVAGVLVLASLLVAGFSWAGGKPAPARTAQFPTSPEPPLADGARPPAPHPAAPLAPPIADEGTPCPTDPEPPVVSLRVRVASTAAAGQELEYQICVENRSNAPAYHVIVRNPLPTTARFVRATPEPTTREPELTWNLGTLEACACKHITLVLTPTGAGDVENCARVQFEHGQCVTTKIVRPALSLKKCGPAQALVNETLSYQLVVTNTGGAEATGVVITDEIPPGLEHSTGKKFLTYDVGTLAPGQSRCFDYQVVARLAGRHCNRAVAATPTGLRDAAESCVVVAEAKLALAKVGPERRYVNLPTTYQITVTNAGSFALENVVIRDALPPGTTLIRANGGQLAGPDVQWLIGPLAPGAQRTVELVLRANQPGKVCNRATASAERGLTAQAEACTEFVGVSALLIEVVDTGFDPVAVGGESRYVVLIRNTGTAVATNVKLDMLAPPEMAVTRVTGTANSKTDGQRITTNPFNLNPRGEARFTVYGTALRAGDVRFKVDMTSDQLTSGPVHEEESTTYFQENPAPAPRP